MFVLIGCSGKVTQVAKNTAELIRLLFYLCLSVFHYVSVKYVPTLKFM